MATAPETMNVRPRATPIMPSVAMNGGSCSRVTQQAVDQRRSAPISDADEASRPASASPSSHGHRAATTPDSAGHRADRQVDAAR